jgi:threonine dehydrogenase-like Zn-dependent dehydrogenase
MAEYVSLPVRMLHRLPETVPMRRGALVEPLSIAVHGIRSSALRPGDRALVLGAGTIGLLTMQCALVAGAREVYVSDLNPHRLELAKTLGAVAVFNPQKDNLAIELSARTDGLGPELVFVCTAAVEAFQDAMTLVKKGGQVFVLGLCLEPVPTDFMSVVLGELDIRGGYLGPGAYPTAIDYIAKGEVEVDPLLTHEIVLEDIIAKGFEEMLKPDTSAVKILVKF